MRSRCDFMSFFMRQRALSLCFFVKCRQIDQILGKIEYLIFNDMNDSVLNNDVIDLRNDFSRHHPLDLVLDIMHLCTMWRSIHGGESQKGDIPR